MVVAGTGGVSMNSKESSETALPLARSAMLKGSYLYDLQDGERRKRQSIEVEMEQNQHIE